MAIYGFALIFAAVVCAIGGKKGVYAILSLVFAFACIIGIMFPMMYRGISPIVLTIIVAVLTTIVTLGLLGGYSEQNSVRNPWNSDRSRDRSSGSDGIWKSSRDHRV